MLSKAFINETNLPYYFISPSEEYYSMIRLINNIFDDAIKNTPSVIFLDDLDKFASSSDRDIFNIIQANIDKVRDYDIYVIATLNENRNIPSSLLRKGRFDTPININYPSYEDRILFLTSFLENKNIADNIVFSDISSIISSFTPVEMKEVINTALMIALNKNKDKADIEDFIESIIKVNYKNNKWKENKNLLEIAYHEAGHALVMEALNSNNVGFISVIGHSDLEGLTILKKELDRSIYITTVALAGKASVEINLAKHASGCSSDINKAQAASISTLRDNCTYGYNFNYVHDSLISNDSLQSVLTYRLAYYEKVAKHILLSNKELLNEIVKLLLNKGYILESEFKTLISKYPIDRTYSNGLI